MQLNDNIDITYVDILQTKALINQDKGSFACLQCLGFTG